MLLNTIHSIELDNELIRLSELFKNSINFNQIITLPKLFRPIIYLEELNTLSKPLNESLSDFKNLEFLIEFIKLEIECFEEDLIESLEQDPYKIDIDYIVKHVLYIDPEECMLKRYNYHKLFNILVNEEWKKLSEYILENPSSFKFLKKFLHKRSCIFLEELMSVVLHPDKIEKLFLQYGNDISSFI